MRAEEMAAIERRAGKDYENGLCCYDKERDKLAYAQEIERRAHLTVKAILDDNPKWRR